jgi:hypothetical protein
MTFLEAHLACFESFLHDLVEVTYFKGKIPVSGLIQHYISLT